MLDDNEKEMGSYKKNSLALSPMSDEGKFSLEGEDEEAEECCHNKYDKYLRVTLRCSQIDSLMDGSMGEN